MEYTFILKKILSAFLMPLSLGLILAFIGLIFLYFNSYKKAKIILSLSFLWIFFISYGPLSNKVLAPLENTYEKVSLDQKASYILLLGGDYESRAYEALRLYYLNKGSKIITSGYKGRGEISEAIINANKLISLGIPQSDILIQESPKDTKEEALSVKEIVKNEKFFLVTSAYHMKRAMRIFEKEGLNVIAAPTRFLVKNNYYLSVPMASSLNKTEVSFHEYLGLIWLDIKELLN